MATVIYALKDPETKKIRYIGYTSFPKKRLSVHLADKHRNHRTNWIGNLRGRGLCPEMEILVEVPQAEASTWEIKFIATARKMGLDLVNGTEGGETSWCRGMKASLEARANMSAAKRGKKLPPFSSEHRARIGSANRGLKRTPEQNLVNSAFRKGKPWSVARRAAYEASK